MTTVEFLSQLRDLNIKIWKEDGNLRYSAPKGALTPALREAILAHKAQILAWLTEAAVATGPAIRPIAHAGPLPLSFAQQRLWFLDQLTPGSSLYNIPVAIRLTGSLDVSALEQSLSEIVRRHEVVRMRFWAQDGQPMQQPGPAWAVSLPPLDLQMLPEIERAAEASRLVNEEGLLSFDLAHGPLLRTKLLRLDTERHILLLTLHHIVADGWSLGVLIRELAALYGAYCTGTAAHLPDLPVQYADYVLWQREWVESPAAKAQLAYWTQQFASDFPTLELPLDRPRPAAPTYPGKSRTLTLSRTLSTALKTLSAWEDVTLFMTLLSAFKIVLSRYVGHADLVVGSPVAGRTQVQVEGLIGCFLNTIILRTDLSGNPTFREVLRRVRATTLGSYAHQELPFEQLLAELQPKRDLQRSPLFRVFFNMLNFPLEQSNLHGLAWDVLVPPDIGAKFDMTLYVREQADEIGFELVYNEALFEQERMRVILEQLEHVLAQIVEHPDAPIATFSLMTPTTQTRLPNPTAALDVAWNGPVQRILAEQARRVPATEAVIDTETAWTYAELDAWSNRIANYLIAHGIQRQHLVAVYAHRSAALVGAVLGVLKAGAAFMILDPAYPAARLIDSIQVAPPQAWIQLTAADTPDDALAVLVAASCVCRLELSSDLALEADGPLAMYSADDPQIAVAPDDLAYIAFTSGSTGQPKAVAGTHRPLSHFLQWHIQTFDLHESDRFSMLSGLAHDPLLRDMFTPLTLGATLCIPDPEQINYPGWLAGWIERESISIVHLTPAMGQLLADGVEPNTELGLRYAFFGGDILTWRDVTSLRRLAPHVTCVNFYGTTETPQAMGYYIIPNQDGAADVAEALEPGTTSQIPIGSGIADVQLLVLNTAQQLTGIGELGEIYVRTPYLSLGYLGNLAATQERFLSNPFTTDPEDRLYRTGDLGRYRVEGTVEFAGRADRQVKIRGFRIELDEITATLDQHPQIRDRAVMVREDHNGDKEIIAYIVMHGTSNTVDDVYRFLSTQLPHYMLPSAIVALEVLPLTPNGKIDYRALPAPDHDRSVLDELFTEPSTATEAALVDIWAQVFKVRTIGVHTNFFEMGGHSLLATQIMTRVRDRFQIDIPLRRMFEAPTIAGLAALIDAARGVEQIAPMLPLRPIGRERPLPASFAQQRMWLLNQLDPESPAYNIPTVLRLTGLLNLPVLELALNEIVRRHEILRTTFALLEDDLVQMIAPPQPMKLNTIDLRADAPATREEQIERLTLAEVQQPFDLVRGPLMRVTLLHVADDEHVVLLTMHHIVADGWSTEVFIRELAALYDAFGQQCPSLLPDLALQYADFAHWQRQWLQGPVLQAHLDYWRQHLQGAPPTLDLPIDRPRPAIQTSHGARYPFLLPPPLAEALRTLSQREGVTLFMTLLSAFQILLSRYTGAHDIVVGTPIAGRTHLETEGLIGFFVNTLVLRSDVSGNPSFREVLRRVQEVTTNAYIHQDLPFEKLVEELQPTRDLSRTPLFQVMFILQNVPMATQQLPGLNLQLVGIDTKTAQFDVTLVLTEVAEGIRGRFEYNTDLFDAATIGRMVAHFQTVLEQMVDQPDRRMLALPLLTAAEQHMLAEWNNTTISYPHDTCIHHEFEAQAVRTPEAIAVVFQDQELTYRELNRRANCLAHHLRAVGVTRGTLVGISMLRSLELPVAILGVLKAGGTYLPLDPTYPQARLALMIDDSQVPLLLTQQHLVSQLPPHGATMVCLDSEWATIGLASDTNPDIVVSPDDLAYVIYTSGSTGKPKGVLIQHRNVVNFFAGMDQHISSESGGTWLSVTSISFDISVLELLWTLARGFRVVIQANWGQALAPDAAPVTKPIDFSLFYFSSGEGQDGADKYRLLLEGAKFADQHGFTAVWTPERHFHSFGGLYPNPSVVSGALAVLTERIQIRAGSVVLPLQNPVRVAEEWAIVDNLSKGRVGLSFASGWHPDDFVLAPDKFSDRRAIMMRDIETVRQLWRGESVTLKGGAGNDVEVTTLPRPIQPELPVWITAAGSPDTFRLAGEAGANLLTHLLGQSIDDLQSKLAIYRQAWREHGHGGEGHVTLMLHTFVGEDLERVRAKVRRPFGEYLKDSISLWKNLAHSMGYDINSEEFTKAEEEALLEHALDRYAETSALLGTPETCLQMIDRLKRIGVDELACLIDFGVDVDSVLSSLQLLNMVKERSNQLPPEDTTDYTLPAQMIRHNITHLQCTPSLARMLLAETDTQLALGSLRQLLLGGEELPAELEEQLSAYVAPNTIYNMYGPTETTIWSAVHPVAGGERSVPIGRPIANTTIFILDPALNPVSIGVVGELYIGGDGVSPGYLRRPELTAERFIPNPFSRVPGERLYRTGDQARYLPDGTIDFLGRRDQQVKMSGYRIELGEIETALRQYPAVAEAVVVVREDEPSKRYLAAYVVPRQATLPVWKPALTLPEQERLLAGRQQYTLPNGMVIAHLSDLQAAGIYREIFEDALYLRHGITITDHACIFDVGANIGMFTLLAGHQARGVQVFSFEPSPPTFDVLQTNVALYGLDAKVFPFGLSDKIEDVEFTFYPEMAGLSGRYAEAAHDRQATKTMIMNGLQDSMVQANVADLDEQALDDWLDRQFKSERYICHMRTLSDMIRQHNVEKIDLLKIDVEKAELDVLCGIEEGDWNKIDQIVMEVDTRENLSRIVHLLESKGYHVIVEDLVIVQASDETASSYVYMLYAARHPLEKQAPIAVGSRERARSNATGHEQMVAALRGYLKDRLPDYMLPSVFTTLPALPLTPNGKVDRKALPAPQGSRAGTESAYVAPRTEVEQAIATIWQSLIHVEKVGIHDNFFELGGTSLLITQVRSRLRNELGYDVSLVDLFRYPTVRALADYLSATKPAKPSFDKVRERAERQMAKRQRRSLKG